MYHPPPQEALTSSTTVSQYDIVETAEDLKELRRLLAQQRRNDTRSPIPGEPEENRSPNWRDNIDGLVFFLEDLREILHYTIQNRVDEDARDLFLEHFEVIARRISIAIGVLTLIPEENHEEDPIFQRLMEAELTGTPGLIKLREWWGGIGRRPLVDVLETGDRILKSLFPIISELEPVNEFKEMLEDRLKHGGDAGLQSLNLGGREQWWKKTK